MGWLVSCRYQKNTTVMHIILYSNYLMYSAEDPTLLVVVCKPALSKITGIIASMHGTMSYLVCLDYVVI